MKLGVNKFSLNKNDFDSYKDYRKEYHRLYKNTDVSKEYFKKHEQTDKTKETRKKYRQTDAYKMAQKRYRQSHPEKVKESAKKWRKTNLGKMCSYTAKYNAAKLQRTVAWSDLDAIKEFYENCKKGMAVDHIYPLQGKEVSGLHVLNNLQYLTPKENSSKANKLLDEYKNG